MSGAFPSTVGFETLDWQSNTTSRVTTSVSGKTQRLKVSGQYWSFKLKSPYMSRASVMADYSFLVQQDGQASAFTIVPPEVASTRGTATGTITVLDDSTFTSASMAAGSKNVPVANAGNTGTLKKGDLIKFSNHNKVYMLTEDVNLDGSTINTLGIYPGLTTALTGTETVTYNNVPITVYLEKDEVSYATQANGLYRYEITLKEEI